MSAIAIALGLAALFSQATPPPPEFVEGALTRGQVVMVEGFVGLEWVCEPERDEETCYAGLTWSVASASRERARSRIRAARASARERGRESDSGESPKCARVILDPSPP